MPMTIYKFAVFEDQELILPVDDADFEAFFAMDGRAIEDWAPPVMRMVAAEQAAEEPSYSDFPWLGEHASILKKPAVDALAPVLAQYGQLLPLRGENVWLFNVTTVLDALDREKSSIVYFDDGDILDIERYVFKKRRLRNRRDLQTAAACLGRLCRRQLRRQGSERRPSRCRICSRLDQ